MIFPSYYIIFLVVTYSVTVETFPDQQCAKPDDLSWYLGVCWAGILYSTDGELHKEDLRRKTS